MTAIPGDDDYLDPEEAAEKAANSAYARYALLQGVLLALSGSAAIFFTLADIGFGVLAALRVPQWLFGFLVSFMIADIARWLYRIRHRNAERREAEPVSEGDRMAATLDGMRQTQAEIDAPWRQRAKKPEYWLTRSIRLVYLACAGLVLTALFGLTAGLVIVGAYIAAQIALGEYMVKRLMPKVIGTFAFMDPRPPRDTPEM